MLFKDILGNDSKKKLLSDLVYNNRAPHALLFYGREGTAKLSLALAYAQYILCENRTEHDSCGVCPACYKSMRRIHPDVHFTFPVIKKDGKKREETTSNDFLGSWRYMLDSMPEMSIKDWSSNINAENSLPNINTRECNEIIQKLSLKAFEGDAKVMIVWMPEYLGKEGNRLLKIIEEPTDNTYIILICEDIDKILGTILSRTQKINVQPYTDAELQERLQATVATDGIDLKQITLLADGNMSKAMSIIRGGNEDYSTLLFDWIRASYKGKPETLQPVINACIDLGREKQKHFLQYGLHFFREYLYILGTGSRGKRINDQEYEIASKMKKIIDLEMGTKIVHILNQSIEHISRNANPKILFMANSLQLGDVLKNTA